MSIGRGFLDDHIDHVVQMTGIEHAGVGSDVDLYGYDQMDPAMNARLRAGYTDSYAFRERLDTDGFDHPRKFFDLTEALLRSIPKLRDPSHTRLRTIGGRPPNLIDPPPGCRFSPRCPYVQDRCRHEEPPLRPAASPGHEFRCWFPVGTPEGAEALRRNRATEGLAGGAPAASPADRTGAAAR